MGIAIGSFVQQEAHQLRSPDGGLVAKRLLDPWTSACRSETYSTFGVSLLPLLLLLLVAACWIDTRLSALTLPCCFKMESRPVGCCTELVPEEPSNGVVIAAPALGESSSKNHTDEGDLVRDLGGLPDTRGANPVKL